MPTISSLRNTREKSAALWKALCAVLLLLGATGISQAQPTGVYREVWTGLSGSSLLSLTNGPTLQNPPTVVEILTNAFEGPYNYDEKFGDRFRALMIPPISGTYVFWVQGDDAGLLSLSTDESPWNKRQIAVNTQTALYRAWYVYPGQESTNIFLQAGRRYYIEALHSAGTGDDSFAVGWKLPDGTLEQPIPGFRMNPFGLTVSGRPGFSIQPTNVSATENSSVTFLVGVTNLDEVTYQWQRNGTNLPFGFGASYFIPSVSAADNGATFRCLVSNSSGSVTSFQATLTVTLDSVKPALSSVANVDAGTVEVLFSEPVDAATGTNVANYAFSGGASVNSARFVAGSTRAVQLGTSPLNFGNSYTLTVNNVKDRAAVPNTILANSQLSFPALLKGVYRQIYTNIPGSAIFDLTNSPAFPGSPSLAELMTGAFETASYQFNHYGQRLRARILPPVTGNYTFWVAAGNSAVLFLGTNSTSASARQIASVTELTPVSPHQWDVQTNQRSAPITLTGGQQYYLEAWMKGGISEGFPADHLSLRWQLPDGTIEDAIGGLRFAPEGIGFPTLTEFPTDITLVEGSSATFNVAVGSLEKVTYQWQQNGTNIPGATNATYIDAVVRLTENNTTLRCVVSNGYATTNTPTALLTVTPDVTTPFVVNAFNQGSNRVVVIFSEPMEEASATNAANYSIGGIIVSNAVLQSDNRTVFLATSKLFSGSNYLLTISGVWDRATFANSIDANNEWLLQASDFFPQDIGSPALGSAFVSTANGVNITASGSGLSEKGDQLTFSYQQRRGDFDVKVRLQRLDFADTWTFAGIMAREDLTTNCQFAGAFSTPSINGSFFEYRTNGAGPQITGSFPANYPYTWLRLQRLNGQTYTGYASYDGLTWTKLGSVTQTNPATMYVGLAVSSRNPGKTTIAEFRDFADVGDNDVAGTFSAPTEPLGPSSRRTGLVISEIMYHPAPRTDLRKLEFIELYNSNPTIEDISGFRISGDVDYTFPAGTIIPGGGFLVIARSPADIQTIYGIPNVMGPYAKSLSNKSGTVRLRNRQDGILLEVNYDSKAPWPPGPDGTGHSLVLARPSFGEDHPEAWAQSDRFGGSPGKVDGFGWEPGRNVLINEILAHTDFPDVDYVELYNHSKTPIDLSGCWLTDDPTTNKFRIPNGTTIPAGGFVYFTETTMGFGLSAAGEAIYLVNSNLTRVLDCLSFEAQENGVAYGRFPDGAPRLSRLAARTPGGTNAPIRAKNMVINEIMYHPISDDDNDEYIELYNRGPGSVNLSGWRFTDGIDFTFPTNTIVASNAYLVVAKNAARIMSNYNLTASIVVGSYTGTLGNSGERVALAMPDTILTTNLSGVVTTNLIYIPVDEVLYGTGGRWGKWSDGGGSSLELIDPRSDNRLPSNWADSDDTSKSTWTSLSLNNATFDHAQGSQSDWNELQLYMLDAGECLVDSVSVSFSQPFSSGNIVTNGGFESGMNFWTAMGDHRTSFIENSGFAGSKSLHVVSTGRGDTGANRIHTILTQQYITNYVGSMSAQVKWLHGPPFMLLRLRGNHLEIPATLNVPKNLGTPGARNSRFVANVGPAITEIQHLPVLPAPNQPIVVTARIHDPDGISSAQVVWRLDVLGSPNNTITMVDNGTGGDAVAGDGVYTATIPGQGNDKMVAFYVQATDAASPGLTTKFPNDAPTRECLVHIGEEQPISTFGTYRFWMTQSALNDWLQHEKFSSEDYKGTFVLGNYRVIYNAGSHYAGSPAHAKLYDSPIGTNCDYQLSLPADDALLDETSLRIQEPGLFGADSTCQNEQFGYWMINQLGLPSLNRRSVNIYMNGVHRGLIYEDTQRQNSGFDEEWYPDANPDLSDLYRIGYWYEFSDDLLHRSDEVPSLQGFTTTGGVKKLARYRQTFNKRAVKDSPHNYTNLFNLVDTMTTTATGEDYAAQVYSVVDIKGWARAFAAERILNNTDLYGAKRLNGPDVKPGAQNSFLFKPAGDTWKFLIWDIDAGFLGLPTDPLFDFTDAPVSNMFTQPLVLRHYWQALEDAAYGPLQPSVMYPVMDSKYDAYVSSGVAASSPQKMKDFLNIRRDYIIELLNGVRSGFGITNNGGLNFTNGSTVFTLGGYAPISAHKITINGVNYPLSWSTITNWYVRLALSSQTNVIVVQGYDTMGNPLANATRTITVYYNGPVSRAEDALVINEIMYNPAVSNASYVEIYNRSTNTTFDLWNYRLDGVDFNFKAGTFIPPQGLMVVVENRDAFQRAYGTNALVAGEFTGKIDRDGESLKLIRQAPTTNEVDVLIDRVKYEARAPWSLTAAATNSGASLQLIDAAQDNARVSNWDDGVGWQFFTFTGKPNSSSTFKLWLYLSGAGDVYLDDIRVVLGTSPTVGTNWLRNGDFESPISTGWTFAGTKVNTSVSTNTYAKSGTNSLHLVFTGSGSTSDCLNQDFSNLSFSSSDSYTVSFWYRPSLTAGPGLNLTVQLGSSSGSAPKTNLTLAPLRGSPGQPNYVVGTVTPYPLLWINEVQPNNTSGLQDNTGTPQPWLELFNSSTNAISLDGLYLSRGYTNLTEWAFPTGAVILPGQFRIIFVDGQPQLSTGSVLHTSFRLSPTNGSLALSRGQQILDYVNYTNMSPNLSYGSYPDGQLFDRQIFYFITPGASNNPAPVPVVINEWMASNTRTITNALKNKFDDWIELYNFGTSDINLGGYYLTDDLSNKKKFRIPTGFTIPARGFAFCWADNDPTLTNLTGNAVHASFAISKSGGELGLFDPGGIRVDAVTFGAQTSDVSQGRFPDGNVAGVLSFMPTPTPRTNNVITNNLYAPVLTAIADVSINEGSLFTLTAHATDNDFPAQQLSYTLLAGSPEGMVLNPQTGVLTWTPSELQGGAVYPISIRVSDNSAPAMTDTKSFNITVTEVNSAPVIGPIANQTASPATNLSLVIPGSDTDIPAQTLTYQLLTGPAGASVSTSGSFSWTPTTAQQLTTNLVVVKVADNGAPSLSATQSFIVTVRAGNVCGGYFGDVTDVDPLHPANTVDVLDWVQIGRFSALLEFATNSCQLQKAKCSPNTTPDTNVTVLDWVQAGRYAAQIDPWISISSGSSFAPGKALVDSKVTAQASSELSVRTIKIGNTVIERGRTNCVQILLNAQGDENALSFSVDFDTNVIRYVTARLGSGGYSTEGSPAFLNKNANSATNGRVAFSMSLPADETFYTGTQEVVTICFTALPGTGSEATPVSIVDEPVRTIIADTHAHSLPFSPFDGTVVVASGAYATLESINILEDGQVRLRFLGTPGLWELQASSDLQHWNKVADLTSGTGELEYIDNDPPPSGQRFYRAVKPIP